MLKGAQVVKNWGKTSFTVEFLNRDGWSLESVLSLLDEMLEEFSPMIVTYNIAFNVLLFKFSGFTVNLMASTRAMALLSRSWQDLEMQRY